MVSTRQSSSVASSSSSDSYGASTSGTQPEAHHWGGKVLRSGLSTGAAAPPSQDLAVVQVASDYSPQLLDMPPEVHEKIFSYLGFKQVAHLRQVCRLLDKVCQGILNSSFQKLQNQMLHRFQAIKAKMPRRESARRNHPLACESDIVETLHMRLTLLQMTFGKHIERKHCCFFAGEILDEVNRILHYITVTNKLARPYKVTDELFDLTTMAMEFFKEHIEPTLPEIAYFGSDFIEFTFSGSSPSGKYFSLDSPPHGVKGYDSPASGNEASPGEQAPQRQSNVVLRKRIRKIKQGMKRYNSQLSLLRRDVRTAKTKMADQQKQINEYSVRLDEYDKKNEETARKFSTLLQELNKCKTELQYWRSRTSAVPPSCHNCGHPNLAPTPTPTEDLYPPLDGAPNVGLHMDHHLPLEAIEFPTEASTSYEEEFWGWYDAKKDDKTMAGGDKSLERPAKQPNKAGVTSSGSVGGATSSGKAMKRRATEGSCVAEPGAKKPRRALKLRTGNKRVKN